MNTIYTFLITFFFSVTAFCQNTNPPEIGVGDQLPDLKLKNIINYHATEASLSDFKGKWLILDFWGPHCIPCVEAIPKLEEYKKEFPDLEIILVGSGREDRIKDFFNRREQQGKKMKFPCAIDPGLFSMFQVRGIPHYVWIDTNGTVSAITYQSEVTHENLEKFTNGEKISLHVLKAATEISRDATKPFLINGNGGDGRNIMYHSVLTGYTDGLNSSYSSIPLKFPNKISAMNVSIEILYSIAFGDIVKHRIPQTKMVFELENPIWVTYTPDQIWDEWKLQHAYCYELLLPDEKSDKIYEFMRMDLDRLFGLNAKLEPRTTKCIVLVQMEKGLLKTMGGEPLQEWDSNGITVSNKPFSTFVNMLQYYHQKKILVDETGFHENVDITLDAIMIDMDSLRKSLHKYGLDIIEAEREVEMLILKDKK